MAIFSGKVQNSKDSHDPGGKVRIKLRPNIVGGALFSDCGRYRPILWREWDGAPHSGYVLWIGMNPSTADGDVDDPTVRRECDFTAAWGYGSYRKCNVMDLRATHPRSLLTPGAAPISSVNLDMIVDEAKGAQIIVLAFGSLHKKLAHHGSDVVKRLSQEGMNMKCLGLTANGSPKHPLYLRKDSELIKFAA
jgi:hypothetical protein